MAFASKQSLVQWGFDVEPKAHTTPLIRQVHGADFAATSELGAEPPAADAITTTELGREIFVFTADCLPVLFYGEGEKTPLMAVHAGWRGAKAGIVAKGLAEMKKHTSRVTAILGPCLGKCCFEVREDFISEFVQARGNIEKYLSEVGGKTHFDLVGFVVEQELKGLQGHVDTTDVRCTFCSTPPLPSYRRNKGTDPRIRSWIVRQSVAELSRTD